MKVVVTVFLLLLAPALHADLVKCDAKKAARNAAMDATVGVSGRCDAEKLVADEKDDLVDDIEDKVDHDHDRKSDRKREGDGLKLRDKDD